ncbi:MAG: tail protein [Firmicutes bacterium]|nr:tail protein [Bacillota bacterium]
MADYRAPGLYLESVTPPDQPVNPLRTDIAGFVGLAARGPVGRAVAVTNREQCERIFGGPVTGLYLAHAARGFFAGGGQLLYMVRVTNDARTASLDLPGGLTVSAGSPGAWANGLKAAVTPARRGAARATAWAYGGDWTEVDATTGFAPGSVVGVSGVTAVVDRLDGRRITWREPVAPVPAVGALLETREFHLRLQLGEAAEEFRFLGVDPAHPRYYGRAVSSAWVVLAGAPAVPPTGTGALQGGTDGLSGLSMTHFADGLRALETLPEVSVVAVPDICAREPVLVRPGVVRAGSPLLSELEQEALRDALTDHCEQLADRFALIDPPPDLDPQSLMDWREGRDSKFAAVYYPWFLVTDPSGPPGSTVWVPPSGHMAGIYARTDLTEGVHRAPANVVVPGVLALARAIREADQAQLNPVGINCLRLVTGQGVKVWGARTLSSDPTWRYVPVRRLMTMVEKAIVEATPWAVFEPHTLKLRFQIINALSTFLEELWRRGALAGATPTEGFYIKCDDEINTPDVIDAGMLVTEVGLAPARPAEFIVVRLERSRDAVQVREVELR